VLEETPSREPERWDGMVAVMQKRQLNDLCWHLLHVVRLVVVVGRARRFFINGGPGVDQA